MKTNPLPGNDVRVPDPERGVATVIQRYHQERAVLLHPSDFHRLNDLEELLAEASSVKTPDVSAAALAAHGDSDAPGIPITDPAALDDLFSG